MLNKNNATHSGELIGPSNYPIGYYNMPKAACTTIKNILYFMNSGQWYSDPLAIHHGIRFKNLLLHGQDFTRRRKIAKFEKPYMVFTFVREPGRRAYSTFIEKIWASGKYAFPGVRAYLTSHHGYSLPSLESNNFSIEEVRAGFKQFLNFAELNLKRQTKLAPNPHWASQFKRIQKLEAADYTSFIGRVESFASDMSFVLEKAGWSDLSITGKRFNEGPKAPIDFDTLIDDEIATSLVRLYANDYLAFGYEPPISISSVKDRAIIPISSPNPESYIPNPDLIINNKKSKQVIAGRMDRLGMRLAIILQSWHFARQIGYQTVALWPTKEINRENDAERNELVYPISDFFDIPATKASIGDDSIIFRDDYFSPGQIFADKNRALAGQFPGRFDRNRIVELPTTIAVNSRAVGLRFYDENNEEIRKSCGDLFRKLVPSVAVNKAFAELSTLIGKDSYIAVHVRRGDIMRTIRLLLNEFNPECEPPANLIRYINMLRSKLAPLSSIVNILNEQEMISSKIVIFSDCDQTSKQLSTLLKGRDFHNIIEYRTPIANSNQRSLAELLLMSKSKILIGTQSAFSRAAHLVGECIFIDSSKRTSPLNNAIMVLDEMCSDIFYDRASLRCACHKLLS